MRPRDWFGVAVRVIGLWFLAQAAHSALWFVWRTQGGEGDKFVPTGEHAGAALISFVVGLTIWLMADPITWVFYGLPPRPAPLEQRETAE